MTGMCELTIDELDIVSGGLDCKSAALVSDIYRVTSIALKGLGNDLGAYMASGQADGVKTGAGPCPQ